MSSISTTCVPVAEELHSSRAAPHEVASQATAPSAKHNTHPEIVMGPIDGGAAIASPAKPRSFWLTLLGILIVLFVYSLDATTLAVAIPSIARQLDGQTLESFWASMSYLLAVTIVQPLYVATSDTFGRKPPLMVAFVFFAVGSVVFALAQSLPVLIVGRILQGLGGGGLDVLAEVILADMTTLKQRASYLGLTAISTALGSVLGPTVGGLFTDFVTWRWLGWVNLPLLAVAFSLFVFFLRLRPVEAPLATQLRRLDWTGILLFLVGCTVFILPVSWAGSLYPWSSWKTIVPLVLGVTILTGFVAYESRPEEPILPHRLFRTRTAAMSLLGAFVHGVSLYVLLQYLPLFYQAIMLDTAIEAAVILLPTSCISVIAAVAAAIIVAGVGKGYRVGLWLVWGVVTLGTGLLFLLDESSSVNFQRGIPVLWGAGVGALLRLTMLPMQASVPSVDDTGRAIGLLLTSRLLGGVVGLSVSSTIFSSVFGSRIEAARRLGLVGGLGLGVPTDANGAIAFIPKLRMLDVSAATRQVIMAAYLDAFRAIFYAMTGFAAVGLLSSLFVEELSLQQSDLGRQRFEEQQKKES